MAHPTSGVWHQGTVAGIARNPLLRAVVEYGRRSMGDQLRFDPTHPRELSDADLRADGRPKVVVNPPAARVTAPARFDPPVADDKVARATDALDRRAGTQRGKPRARDPAGNPLGCRLFDWACGWCLYRQPYNGTFRYCCGYYQQSHGAQCCHNTIDGPTAVRFVLACVRQRVLTSGFRDRVRASLEEIARRELGPAGRRPDESGRLARELADVRRDVELAQRNMALAASPDQFRAVSEVFDQLRVRERELE